MASMWTTSLLCVKKEGGEVTVHDKQMADSLTRESQEGVDAELMRWSAPQYRRSSRPKSTPTMGDKKPALETTDSMVSDASKNDRISHKTVMDLQERNDRESLAIRKMYAPLLETERTFVKQDMGDLLKETEHLNLRKRELLHKNWSSRVYEPMRRQIINKLDCQDWLEADRRRRVLHGHYLEYINKKGFIFLDTLDKGEYYAQAMTCDRPAPLSIYTPELHDPLLSQHRDRSKEDQTILRCQTGNIYSLRDIDQVKLPPLPLVPLGRHGTDSIGWLEMPLGNIESTPRKISRLRMKGNGTKSQMDFEQWAKIPFSPRLIDQEMQTQKKRMYDEDSKPPFGIPACQVHKAPFGDFNNDIQTRIGGHEFEQPVCVET